MNNKREFTQFTNIPHRITSTNEQTLKERNPKATNRGLSETNLTTINEAEEDYLEPRAILTPTVDHSIRKDKMESQSRMENQERKIQLYRIKF